MHMAVRVWIGDPADEGYERSALKELAASLANETGDFDILANFTVGAGRDSSQIDLLVVHGKAWTIVELKHSAGYAVFGQSNGPWKRSDGIEFPGHNPALQVVKQYSTLRRWLHKNCRDFVEPGRLAACREIAAWSDIRKFIGLYPCRNPNSKIDVSGHPGFSGTLGDVIGFDLVKDHLHEPKWQGSLRLQLTEKELERMAGTLGLHDATAAVLAATPTGIARIETSSDTKPPVTIKIGKARNHQKRCSKTKPFLLLASLLIIAVAAAYTWWPRPTIVEATEAWQYIGLSEKIVVRIEVSSVNENGQDRIIYDDRIARGSEHNFSLEINSVGNAALPFDSSDTILVGPVRMGTTEDRNNPNSQVEIEHKDIPTLVEVER